MRFHVFPPQMFFGFNMAWVKLIKEALRIDSHHRGLRSTAREERHHFYTACLYIQRDITTCVIMLHRRWREGIRTPCVTTTDTHASLFG